MYFCFGMYMGFPCLVSMFLFRIKRFVKKSLHVGLLDFEINNGREIVGGNTGFIETPSVISSVGREFLM